MTDRYVATADQLFYFVRFIVKLLDVVALTEDMPAKRLRRGQVGTIVEVLAPGVFEVEFADTEGRTYASLAVAESRLMVLHHKSS